MPPSSYQPSFQVPVFPSRWLYVLGLNLNPKPSTLTHVKPSLMLNCAMRACAQLYAVVNGERRELRLDTVPSLTKRQLSHLSHNAAPSGLRVGRGRRTVITETPVEECFKRTMRQPADERLRAMPVPAASPPPQETPPKEPAACRWPSWQTYVSVTGPERVMPLERDVRAPTMDEGDE
mmetsp:Transcript_16761/g.50233  ORF Transcript_16761/g.50233 Transcript_16761/m.50233 type:complete len:178 (+) Transcript_16761:303-836(+)